MALLAGRDGVRALHYRLRRRRDWWVVRHQDDAEPVATRHPDLVTATDVAERELLAEIAKGGRYLPYGG